MSKSKMFLSSGRVSVTGTLLLIIQLCDYAVLAGSARQIQVDLCALEGGTCVKTGSCTGWVEPYDTSCGRDVCCKVAPTTVNPEPDHPHNDSCGLITRVASSNHLLRIVGGDPALEGEWPWQVAFLDKNGQIFCGGVLITPNFVLTAAHCFVIYNETDTEIVLGEHHLVHNTGNEVRRKARSIIKHGNYQPQSHDDDIAFVQLDAPVDVTGHYVRTACFGSRGLTWSSYDICYASGWGYTKDYSSDSRHLRHVRTSLVDTQSCAAAWAGSPNVTDKMVCAGGEGTGTCQGDSGGPLVCLRDGKYHIVGITSFGHYTCTESGYPDVYTRVASYLDWMTSFMLLLDGVS